MICNYLDKITHNLIKHTNSNTNFTFVSTDELIVIAEEIRNEILVDIVELQRNETPEKIRKVVKTMPAMYMQNKNKSVLINLHKFVHTPSVLKFFLHLRKAPILQGAAVKIGCSCTPID